MKKDDNNKMADKIINSYSIFSTELKDKWGKIIAIERIEIPSAGYIPLGYRVEVIGNENIGFSSFLTPEIFSLRWRGKPYRVIIVGSSGAGKSRLLLRMMYLLKNLGLSPMVMIDPKSEYYFVKNYSTELLPGEEPSSMPYKLLVPKFINSKRKDISEFCLGIDLLTADEAASMFYGDKKKDQAIVSKTLINKAIVECRGNYSLAKMKEIIKNSDDMARTKYTALNILDTLFKYKNAITEKTTHNFIKMMMGGICPIIQYEMKVESEEDMISNYTSMIMRMIYSKMGEIAGNKNHPLYNFKPLLCIDEARVIAPPTKEPPSKRTLIHLYGMTRSLGISIILTIRQLRELAPAIINDATHIIYLGKLTTDIEYLKKVTDPEKVYLADEICVFNKDTDERIGVVFDLQSRNIDFFKPVMGPMDIRKTTSMG